MENKQQQPKKRVNLQSLYPRPKTDDELRQQRHELQMLHENRHPKYIPLRFAALLTLDLVLFSAMATIVPVIVMSSPLFGVSATMLVLLTLGAFVWWQFHFLETALSYRGVGIGAFGGAYTVGLTVFLWACTRVSMGHFSYLYLLVLHFLFVAVLLVILTRASLTPISKLQLLCLVVLATVGGIIAIIARS